MDNDHYIGCWVKKIPYIWVDNEDLEKCQRIHLLNPKDDIVVFGRWNEAEKISILKMEKAGGFEGRRKFEGGRGNFEKRKFEGGRGRFPGKPEGGRRNFEKKKFSRKGKPEEEGEIIIPEISEEAPPSESSNISSPEFQVKEFQGNKNFRGDKNFHFERKKFSFPKTYYLIPTMDDCGILKDCLQVCVGCVVDDKDEIRLEGKTISKTGEINFDEIPILGDNLEIKFSDRDSREVKVYHENVQFLHFYRNIIFRNKLYRNAALDIFGEKDRISPFENYRNIDQKLPYTSKKVMLKYTIHRGQCKLFLNEIQFLTKFMKSNEDPDIVIYPGGCPAHHLWYLIQFFPNIKIVSIDPQACKLFIEKKDNVHFNPNSGWKEYAYLKQSRDKEEGEVEILGDGDPEKFADLIRETNYRVYFYQDFMTVPLAKSLRSLRNTLYISDIRTSIEADNKPQDIDIIWNLSQQYNWITVLRPKAFMLKFRHPFHEEREKIKFNQYGGVFLRDRNMTEPVRRDFEFSKRLGIDFLEDYKNGVLKYLDGVIMIQPFPGRSSTETRLVGTKLKIRDFGSHKEYEEKFAYYNLIRSLGFFRNPLANKELGFDHCGDCSLEYKIWNDYAMKYGKEISIEWMRGLTNITGQKYIQDNHGIKFERLTMEKYKEDYEKLGLQKHNEKRGGGFSDRKRFDRGRGRGGRGDNRGGRFEGRGRGGGERRGGREEIIIPSGGEEGEVVIPSGGGEEEIIIPFGEEEREE